MKTLAIIIAFCSTILMNTGIASAENHKTEAAIRNQIDKKIGMPEFAREKITPATVYVKFSIDENNTILVKEVSGGNVYLNEYVADKLHHSKVKTKPENTDQVFELAISFGKQ